MKEGSVIATPPWLEAAVADRPLARGGVSGDQVVAIAGRERVLLGAIDGIGHGTEAAHASKLAVDTILSMPDATLETLVQACHQALKKTRGAAMMLVELRPEYLWRGLGVGNVEAVLVRRAGGREYFPTAPGVVGYRLPTLRVSQVRPAPGDLLVLATDGISRGSVSGLRVREPIVDIAASILKDHARPEDDALVAVARYAGGAP